LFGRVYQANGERDEKDGSDSRFPHFHIPRADRRYEAGHMMYVNPPSLKKMKGDLDAFIDSTSRP
jgi:carboxypeptidase C (cathepsin A)